jgi:hypothetical protein
MQAAWWARSAGYSAAGSNPRRNEVAPPRRHRRGRGGAPGEQSPAGTPIIYAPDGRDWLSRADGTRPRHLSFLASGRKPWSADNPGSIPGSHRKLGMPARRGPDRAPSPDLTPDERNRRIKPHGSSSVSAQRQARRLSRALRHSHWTTDRSLPLLRVGFKARTPRNSPSDRSPRRDTS